MLKCECLLPAYIAACPYVNATCQACDEESNFIRFVICYKCWTEQHEKRLATNLTENAWSVSNQNGKAEGNNASQCNGFLFCTDCLNSMGIKGDCTNHQ